MTPSAFSQPSAVASALPGADDVRLITDWYIPDDDPTLATIYPGARRLPQTLGETAIALRNTARMKSQMSWDFNLDLDGLLFRGHRQVTVSGVIYILRRISEQCPEIRKLGLPVEIRQILLSRQLAAGSGGLIIICGEPGHGKSTTCAAVIMERLKAGAFCLTVEHPPEFPMHGEHPGENGAVGKCIQVPVTNDGSFANGLRDALRCYPSNARGSMLLVGEVRDNDTAGHLLRAAVNGQLVFTTFHAGSIISCLERILSMASGVMGADEARSLLAQALRGVIHQELRDGRLTVNVLFSMAGNSAAGAQIKKGQLQMLSTEIEQQRTFLANNMLASRLKITG